MSDALTYRAAGVDIDAGNAVVERIKPLVFFSQPLRNEPLDGVADYHFHQFEPRTLRLIVQVPLG